MINDKMQKAINTQINEEANSAYLYLAMSAYFESANLSGFAHWMKLQANEELEHTMKFFAYLIERGGVVHLKSIGEPPVAWKSPLEAFEAAYAHEQHITDCIYKLVELAGKEKDYASANFLQWFVKEQVEEEANASTIVAKLQMIGESKNGLFMMDHQLGKRGED